MIMHHNELCTPCVALVNSGHLFAYTMEHMEPKTEIQVQQVHVVFGGPQVSCCEDANIVVTKASPNASYHIP
jgi:hypothetical protein